MGPSSRRGRCALLVLWALAVATFVVTGSKPAEPIVGGSNTQGGAYPGVALLNNGCTGALIRPEWVLTAGHCVNALRPYVHSVGVGMRSGDRRTQTNYLVSGVRRHPGWPNSVGSGPHLDVALVRLAQPVPDIVPFTLGSPADLSRYDGPSDSVRAVGWGLTSCNMDANSNCTTPAQSNFLQTKLGVATAAGGTITTQFTGGGPCFGDSGSPLIITVPNVGLRVVGTLATAGCEGGNANYANVASGPSRDWLLSALDTGVSEQLERPWTAGQAPVNRRTCFNVAERDTAPEPINLISGRPAYRTSWWVYDPGPNARRFVISTTGSNVDTVLGVFESTGDTLQYDLLQRRYSNDDSGGTFQASVVGTTMNDKPGEKVYVIGVGTYQQNATGQVCVRLIDTAPPTTSTGGDIYWRNSQSNETQIWYMQRNQLRGRGTVLDEIGRPIFVGAPWFAFGANDFNGDRRADILWHNNTTHETQLWFMAHHWIDRRATVLGENGQPVFIAPPWRIVSAADFNGDAKADILWHNNQTHETQIWFMNANRLVSRGTVLGENGQAVFIGPPWRIVGSNDYNFDGKADILWYNSVTGETQMWFMNANRLVSRGTVLNEAGQPIFIGPPFSIVGSGDMNRDFRADILWYNSQTGENQMWFMNGNRLTGRATVVSEGGVPIFIGPPWRVAGNAQFNPVS